MTPDERRETAALAMRLARDAQSMADGLTADRYREKEMADSSALASIAVSLALQLPVVPGLGAGQPHDNAGNQPSDVVTSPSNPGVVWVYSPDPDMPHDDSPWCWVSPTGLQEWVASAPADAVLIGRSGRPVTS